MQNEDSKRPADDDPLAQAVLDTLRFRFEMYEKLGREVLNRLSDADLAWAPEGGSNSIAVLVRHMRGNMISRWTDFLTMDGEKPTRDRDGEFEETGTVSGEELLLVWAEGWECLLGAVNGLSGEDLLKDVAIRGVSLRVIDALHRQLPHVSYHVGQMIWIAKARQGDGWKSLSIPRGQSKNAAVTARLERNFGGVGRTGDRR